jgi:6-aminohexanoate-oligomer endohydrolase
MRPMSRTPTRTFRFDFPELLVGTAEYPAGPTGCTVLRFPRATIGAIDVRGGAAAVRESTSIEPANSFGLVDALFFAGGSTYGLDVGSGVMRELLALKRGRTGFDDIPAVPGAVVYDFDRRDDASVFPDAELGARAFRAARAGEVLVGRAGAGANVAVGSFLGAEWAERSGQGAAFGRVAGMRLFALSVVNAVGNVLDRSGRTIAGSRDPRTGERLAVTDGILRQAPARRGSRRHTTLTALVTDAELNHPELQRLAVMAHSALGRVIEPFATPLDGDTLFALSTGAVPLRRGWSVAELGAFAGQLAQDAVLEAVK